MTITYSESLFSKTIAEVGWTSEANALFEELAQGQILQALIVGYNEAGVPLVHLYKVQGVSVRTLLSFLNMIY